MMIDHEWAIVIAMLIYIFAYFYIAKPIAKQLSVKIKGRNYKTQSATTFDLRTSDGRWDAIMNILVIVIAVLIGSLLFIVGSELGLVKERN